MDLHQLSQSDIRRIQSEQAIPDLAAVLKELVENAIDAHATNIDVLYDSYGLAAIIVRDDGDGIPIDSLVSAVTPHATSKLESHEDLVLGANQFLGFRGEALAAICNLSYRVTLTSMTKGAETAASIIVDAGQVGVPHKIESHTIRGSSGTIIEVQKPLSLASLRWSIFQRESRRFFAESVAVLQDLALVRCDQVSITVRASENKTLRQVFKVQRNENALQVLADLIGVDLKEASDLLVPLHVTAHDDSWSLDGYVMHPLKSLNARSGPKLGYSASAKAATGSLDVEGGKRGRSISKSKLAVFAVNGRPINFPTAIMRILDAVYRRHTSHHCGCCLLKLDTKRKTSTDIIIDVNASVDKRTTKLSIEKDLAEALARKLEVLFADLMILDTIGDSREHPLSKRRKTTTSSQGSSESSATIGVEETASQRDTTPRQSQIVLGRSRRKETETPLVQETETPVQRVLPGREQRETPSRGKRDFGTLRSETRIEMETADAKCQRRQETETPVQRPTLSFISVGSSRGELKVVSATPVVSSKDATPSPRPLETETANSLVNERAAKPRFSFLSNRSRRGETPTVTLLTPLQPSSASLAASSQSSAVSLPSSKLDSLPASAASADATPRIANTQSITLCARRGTLLQEQNHSVKLTPSDLERLKAKLHKTSAEGKSSMLVDNSFEAMTGSRARSMLSNMSVVGSYRKSFIITALVEEEKLSLYIIDQHAADEKTRFEALNISTQISSQPLLAPVKIRMAPHRLLMAQDYEHSVLRPNGFRFAVDEAEPFCTLSATPVAHGMVFNAKDFEQLLDMLETSGGYTPDDQQPNDTVWGFGRSGSLPRPPRLWNILAMKACRSAVKFGTQITVGKMADILLAMTKLQHPWNCPHGRPTTKRLCEVKLTYTPPQ